MPPLGKPSAISYSRSSARSDLKTFTFPLAPYNFRMRAICDESDMRTLLSREVDAESGERFAVTNVSKPSHHSRLAEPTVLEPGNVELPRQQESILVSRNVLEFF